MITVVLRQMRGPTGRPLFGHTGPLYEVTLDGEVIVSGEFAPEYPAARALQARGLSGPFQTTDATGLTRMTFPSIDEAAKWTVVEDDAGIRLRKWVPFPAGGFKDALKRSEGTDIAALPADASLEDRPE